MSRPALFARVLLAAIAVPLLALVGRAGTLWTVDVSGTGQFLQIQPAIDAAQDGDSILVRAGAYAGFTLSGKGLHLFAETGLAAQVDGAVSVLDVPAGSAAVLNGFTIVGPPSTQTVAPPALRIAGNAGHVRLQGCVVLGGDALPGGCFPWNHGAPAAVVSGSLRVALADTMLVGGRGYGIQDPGSGSCTGGNGGVALSSSTSAVMLYDCDLRGGDGNQGGAFGGNGGHGLLVQDFGAFASGCALRGGKGGLGWDLPGIGGDGGDGVHVGGPGQVQLLDNQAQGGAGGQGIGGDGANGAAHGGGGAFLALPGSARVLEAPQVAFGGALLPLTVRGIPGDRVRVARASRSGFRFMSAWSGVWLVPYPTHLTWDPLGVVPPSGVLSAEAAIAPLAPGAQVRNEVLQLVIVDASGVPFLGSPVHVDVRP